MFKNKRLLVSNSFEAVEIVFEKLFVKLRKNDIFNLELFYNLTIFRIIKLNIYFFVIKLNFLLIQYYICLFLLI